MRSVHRHAVLPAPLKGRGTGSQGYCTCHENLSMLFWNYIPLTKHVSWNSCLARIPTDRNSGCANSLTLPPEFWLATEFGQKDLGNPTLFLPIKPSRKKGWPGSCCRTLSVMNNLKFFQRYRGEEMPWGPTELCNAAGREQHGQECGWGSWSSLGAWSREQTRHTRESSSWQHWKEAFKTCSWQSKCVSASKGTGIIPIKESPSSASNEGPTGAGNVELAGVTENCLESSIKHHGMDRKHETNVTNADPSKGVIDKCKGKKVWVGETVSPFSNTS